MRDAVRAFGLHAVELERYEADDLIATYARQAEARGAEVIIVSSDKDLMQLSQIGSGSTISNPAPRASPATGRSATSTATRSSPSGRG